MIDDLIFSILNLKSDLVGNLNGNLKLARQKHYELLEIIHYLFKDGNPAGIKYILKLINICSDKVRLPLVNVSPSTASKLYELVAGIDDTSV